MNYYNVTAIGKPALVKSREQVETVLRNLSVSCDTVDLWLLHLETHGYIYITVKGVTVKFEVIA